MLFFITNGVVGPITEELYFRGHLLPRIDRYGRGAPVLNTILFTLYHFHTPWRWPVIFFGYLPICIASWRKRSLWIGLGAHLLVNNIFVLMMLANCLAQQASGSGEGHREHRSSDLYTQFEHVADPDTVAIDPPPPTSGTPPPSRRWTPSPPSTNARARPSSSSDSTMPAPNATSA